MTVLRINTAIVANLSVKTLYSLDFCSIFSSFPVVVLNVNEIVSVWTHSSCTIKTILPGSYLHSIVDFLLTYRLQEEPINYPAGRYYRSMNLIKHPRHRKG